MDEEWKALSEILTKAETCAVNINGMDWIQRKPGTPEDTYKIGSIGSRRGKTYTWAQLEIWAEMHRVPLNHGWHVAPYRP